MSKRFEVRAVVPISPSYDDRRPYLLTDDEREAVDFAVAHTGPIWPQLTITATLEPGRPSYFAIRHITAGGPYGGHSDTLWTVWEGDKVATRGLGSLEALRAVPTMTAREWAQRTPRPTVDLAAITETVSEADEPGLERCDDCGRLTYDLAAHAVIDH